MSLEYWGKLWIFPNPGETNFRRLPVEFGGFFMINRGLNIPKKRISFQQQVPLLLHNMVLRCENLFEIKQKSEKTTGIILLT